MLDLDAGAYAAFVWPSFAITALVFALMVGSSLSHARHWPWAFCSASIP